MYSAFTSRVTETVEIPQDPPNSVTIRKLKPKHLNEAAQASQFASMAMFHKMGGAAFLKEVQSLGDAATKQIANPDPLMQHDPIVLMERGVTSWTYAEPLTRDSFEDLDDAVSTRIALAILKLAKPSLFHDTVQAEAEQKNV